VERFWVAWDRDADVVAAYEVRVGLSGLETVLYTDGTLADGQILNSLQDAFENLLTGVGPDGEGPRPRNLDDPVACVHARMAGTGEVIVGWGDDPSGDDPGGRAKAYALIAFGHADLEGRRGASG
jgi:hypothetical protein